ncbi:Hypothetical protein SRAE_X000052100 [Strongyloides ratti]|uniref:Transthyretin-like family-containing protein n=1 Tax=Strongyloides ratti TaxID=34506 RepID=A0A090LUC4_STRRB|nr:Hypothetical protein SRAE_X000052100 [Strongyloides ratti]CEF71194.2 Hypothetical protein SRAE_X000052100 [Strongyloides ratti]
MYVLKFIFLTAIFNYMHLTTNGAKFRCYSFFGFKPPCFLYIDILNDNFFAKTESILPKELLFDLRKLLKLKHFFSNVVKELNCYIMGRYNQYWMKLICKKYGAKYKYQTYLTFYTTSPKTNYEKKLYMEVKYGRKYSTSCFKSASRRE